MENNGKNCIRYDKSLIACFTGHRIIGGADLPLIQNKLDETIAELIGQNISIFLSGGAIGYDTIAAQSVLKAREDNPGVKLIMVLPCGNQESKWREADKKAYRCLLENADEVVYVSEQPYFDGCMEKRNMFLVEHSAVCVAYTILNLKDRQNPIASSDVLDCLVS